MDVSARLRLLDLARCALEARVRGVREPDVPDDLNEPASGVFVTIHACGELRGCLGTLDPRERLADAVVRLAGDVASEDLRFQPVRLSELPEVTIDLSILTPPEEVIDLASVQVGRDGLIVEDGGRKGLLLPQVATEQGWDRDAFLSYACVKAGLPADAWRRGARVFRFEAEVFGEGTALA
jgi:AmmeMemoRadiSam system protein A